jgi:hypothetical protein
VRATQKALKITGIGAATTQQIRDCIPDHIQNHVDSIQQTAPNNVFILLKSTSLPWTTFDTQALEIFKHPKAHQIKTEPFHFGHTDSAAHSFNLFLQKDPYDTPTKKTTQSTSSWTAVPSKNSKPINGKNF